jgi:hypothetical protein
MSQNTAPIDREGGRKPDVGLFIIICVAPVAETITIICGDGTRQKRPAGGPKVARVSVSSEEQTVKRSPSSVFIMAMEQDKKGLLVDPKSRA